MMTIFKFHFFVFIIIVRDNLILNSVLNNYEGIAFF